MKCALISVFVFFTCTSHCTGNGDPEPRIIFSGPSTADDTLVHGGSNFIEKGVDTKVEAIVGFNNHRIPNSAIEFTVTGVVRKSVDELKRLFSTFEKPNHRPPGMLLNDKNYVNPVVRKSLVTMADAIDNLDARLSRVEKALNRRNSDKHTYWTPSHRPTTLTSIGNSITVLNSCKGQFQRVNNKCVFASSRTNQRTNWKNSEEICKGKGGRLLEIHSYSEFREISNYLSRSSLTKGFSYWLGSIYPGGLWLWMSGSKVSLDSTFWNPTISSSFTRSGDTSAGRCLTFAYNTLSTSYHFAGAQCADDKFFLCEM